MTSSSGPRPEASTREAPSSSADPRCHVRRGRTDLTVRARLLSGSLVLGAAGLLTGLDATTWWGAVAQLEAFGARYSTERVVRQGKIVTSAGVSSGIDMALHLAAWLSDDVTAQAIQLYTEYDPQPPFDSGSVAKASPSLLERARALG